MANIHPESQYYLHTGGNVIYKPHGDVDMGSTFVKACWDANKVAATPWTYYTWLVMLVVMGARQNRVAELFNKNKLEMFIPGARRALIDMMGLDPNSLEEAEEVSGYELEAENTIKEEA